MEFPQPLVRARFVRREKRFLIHAILDTGEPVVAHTNNTGRMTGSLFADGPVWLSPAAGPARKLAWTLEIAETLEGVLVGVNTQLANRLVAEALASGLLDLAGPGPCVRAEVPYPGGSSRADFLVNGALWVEVKNVSLVVGGRALFPDAPTARGRKHLQDLRERVDAGERAALVLCSQRADACTVGPADHIDPAYGALLREVHAAGVEVYGLGADVAPGGIRPARVLPVRF
ncbi:MAG: DNA/RNA nuclease SfsA [bacterium]